jgi:hypothetical protein
MGDAVTACRFCHASPEHIGQLAACPVVRAWFAPFLALVGIPKPSVPELLFTFPSSGHGGIRHLAIITWRRILQLFYSDAAIFSHTTPDQVTTVALARFAELAQALSHRISYSTAPSPSLQTTLFSTMPTSRFPPSQYQRRWTSRLILRLHRRPHSPFTAFSDIAILPSPTPARHDT